MLADREAPGRTLDQAAPSVPVQGVELPPGASLPPAVESNRPQSVSSDSAPGRPTAGPARPGPESADSRTPRPFPPSDAPATRARSWRWCAEAPVSRSASRPSAAVSGDGKPGANVTDDPPRPGGIPSAARDSRAAVNAEAAASTARARPEQAWRGTGNAIQAGGPGRTSSLTPDKPSCDTSAPSPPLAPPRDRGRGTGGIAIRTR